MTDKTNYTTIDALLVQLLRSEDGTAIISNFAGLKRKLEAARLDAHDVQLRKKGPATNEGKVWEAMLNTEQAAHKKTKQELGRTIELLEESLRIEKAKKKAGEDDMGYLKQIEELKRELSILSTKHRKLEEKQPEQASDILELITTAIKVDRKGRDEEIRAAALAQSIQIESMKAKLKAVAEAIKG